MADGSWRHIDVVIDNRLPDDSVRGLLLNPRDVSSSVSSRAAAPSGLTTR